MAVAINDGEMETLINEDNLDVRTVGHDVQDKNEDDHGSWLFHPSRFGHRVIALILMCLLGFGSYFCFDNPGALQKEIKSTMHVTTYQFANLYSLYSWPNVILPAIGGYLIDTILGLRLGASLFSFILIIGQVFFALGAYLDEFLVMEIGRFIFGIGGESLTVAQNYYTTVWFSGKALNLVFGLQLSVARLGSTVNFQVVEPIFRSLKDSMTPFGALGTTLMIAGISCVISFICSVILGLMDKRAEKILNRNAQVNEDDRISLRSLIQFPTRFWLLCIICVAYYVAIFPFVSLGQAFFMKKFSYSSSAANFINGLIYLISAFASPVFGILIDKTGLNMTYVFLAVVSSMVGHFLLAFTFLNPYVAVVILSLSYSLLASALWPIATFIVPQEQLGTAFGFMQAIQNFGLATITMLAGLIVDKAGFMWMEIFFLFCLSIALVATVILWCLDKSHNGYINMTVAQREAWDSRSCLEDSKPDGLIDE